MSSPCHFVSLYLSECHLPPELHSGGSIHFNSTTSFTSSANAAWNKFRFVNQTIQSLYNLINFLILFGKLFIAMVDMKQQQPTNFCKFSFIVRFDYQGADIMSQLNECIHNADTNLNCRRAMQNCRKHRRVFALRKVLNEAIFQIASFVLLAL